MIRLVFQLIVLLQSSLGFVRWETVYVSEIHSLIKSGHKCESIVREFNHRILKYNKNAPGINAVLSLDPRAIEEAHNLDDFYSRNGIFKGSLHCAPTLIKDNIDVRVQYYFPLLN